MNTMRHTYAQFFPHVIFLYNLLTRNDLPLHLHYYHYPIDRYLLRRVQYAIFHAILSNQLYTVAVDACMDFSVGILHYFRLFNKLQEPKIISKHHTQLYWRVNFIHTSFQPLHHHLLSRSIHMWLCRNVDPSISSQHQLHSEEHRLHWRLAWFIWDRKTTYKT